MAWDDNTNNPWGRGPNRPQNNAGRGGPRGAEPPPELEEMLKRAQENLRQVMPGGFGGGRIVIISLVAIIALWLTSGFFIINPGEYGVIQRFGAYNRTQVTEGLSYRAPWPIESMAKVNVSEVRRMEIGFSERTGLRANSGMKQDIPEESLMLTSDANIVNLDLVVLWNIKSAESYLFQIQNPENTIKKVAESAIREVVGQTGMFPIITQARDEVANRARQIMTANLDDYESGINITQVLILEAEVHPDVQEAFQDVQSARQDAFEVQNRAQAYREDILPKARGQAIKMLQEAEAYQRSVVARAEGDAERFNAVLAAYRSGEDVTRNRIYLETMEDVLQNAQKIIMDGNGRNGSGVVPYLPLDELRTNRPSSSNNSAAQ